MRLKWWISCGLFLVGTVLLNPDVTPGQQPGGWQGGGGGGGGKGKNRDRQVIQRAAQCRRRLFNELLDHGWEDLQWERHYRG